MIRRVGWVVTALAAALLGGCGSDDDPVRPPIDPAPLPRPTTPQNVLALLSLSYENRDSTQYRSLYDLNYVGTSQDLNDPGTPISTFSYADEATHIRALARSTTIVSVVLDFGLSSSWIRLASDDPSHPEWAVMQINNVNLQIYDGPTLYSGQATNPMTFSFIPAVTAPGDTTWKIIRWNEVGGGP